MNCLVLPEMKEKAPEGSIFMQDGARIHTTFENVAYIWSKFDLLEGWPAKSPDLNIIENIWGIMQIKLDALFMKEGPITSEGQLEERCHRVWNSISMETIQKLYASVEKRYRDVITNNGLPINY